VIDVPKRDYYELLIYKSNISGIQPKPTASLSCLPTLNALESRMFDFFRLDIIPELADIRSTIFWRHLILPACYSEPAVLHASLAIAYLRRCRAGQKSGLNRIEADSLRLTGVAYYNKAIRCVSEYLQNREIPTYLGVILMTSVLFVVFELYDGSLEKAILHSNGGRKLVLLLNRDRKALSNGTVSEYETQSMYFAARPDSVEDKIVNMFAHLDLQASYFGSGPPQLRLAAHENEPPKANVSIIGPEPPPFINIPTRFSSFHEANQHLVVLENECLRFTGHAYDHTKHTIGNHRSNCHRRYLSTCLRTWRKAYSQPFSTTTQLEKGQLSWKSQSALMLIQHAWLTIIVASSYLEVEETELDCLTEYFTTIVNSATSLIPPEVEGRSANRKDFALALGLERWRLVPPLYWTAIKCRHPKIRREALSLLTCVGGEGFWDSILMHHMAVEIVMLEEGPDCSPMDANSLSSMDEIVFSHEHMDLGAFVPPRRRISGATTPSVDTDKQMLQMTFKRKRRDEEGLWTGDFDLITVERPLKSLQESDKLGFVGGSNI
jgi:hypothetical protein